MYAEEDNLTDFFLRNLFQRQNITFPLLLNFYRLHKEAYILQYSKDPYIRLTGVVARRSVCFYSQGACNQIGTDVRRRFC